MNRILKNLKKLELNKFAGSIEELVEKKHNLFSGSDNQLINKFRNFYKSLPQLKTDYKEFSGDFIKVGKTSEITKEEYEVLNKGLKNFIPWRKGPFNIFGIEIETEWASNLKWQRFADHLDLKNKKILDIGSSNGYYLFKMADHSPLLALGLEPFIPYYYQFQAINKYIEQKNIFTIPATFQEMPVTENFFDYVFCMGVLYHRKSPIKMLSKIRRMTAKNGVLILENLIIEGDEPLALIPEDRYAKMNNVHFIPTIKTLEVWLKKSGFRDIECLDITKTEFNEQEKTDWSFSMSLEDFLDPGDKNKTIEGYPAPIRAVIKARRA